MMSSYHLNGKFSPFIRTYCRWTWDYTGRKKFQFFVYLLIWRRWKKLHAHVIRRNSLIVERLVAPQYLRTSITVKKLLRVSTRTSIPQVPTPLPTGGKFLVAGEASEIGKYRRECKFKFNKWEKWNKWKRLHIVLAITVIKVLALTLI